MGLPCDIWLFVSNLGLFESILRGQLTWKLGTWHTAVHFSRQWDIFFSSLHTISKNCIKPTPKDADIMQKLQDTTLTYCTSSALTRKQWWWYFPSGLHRITRKPVESILVGNVEGVLCRHQYSYWMPLYNPVYENENPRLISTRSSCGKFNIRRFSVIFSFSHNSFLILLLFLSQFIYTRFDVDSCNKPQNKFNQLEKCKKTLSILEVNSELISIVI